MTGAEHPITAVERMRRHERKVLRAILCIAAAALMVLLAAVATMVVLYNIDEPDAYRDAAIGQLRDVPQTWARVRVTEGDRRHLINRIYEFAGGRARPRYDTLDPGSERKHLVEGVSGDEAAVLAQLDSRPWRLSPGYRHWPGAAPAGHPYTAGPYTFKLEISELRPYQLGGDIALGVLIVSVLALIAVMVVSAAYWDSDTRKNRLRRAEAEDRQAGR